MPSPDIGDGQPEVGDLLPVRVDTFRFAPSRGGFALASVWKFWAPKSDIYALARTTGNAVKVSVHCSGQIHVKLKERPTFLLRRATPVSNGWSVALELRFLCDDVALRPIPEIERAVGKKILFLEVPEGFCLQVHLLIGKDAATAANTLPPHKWVPPPTVFWKRCLRDGRPVALVGRGLPQDEKVVQAISELRREFGTMSIDREPVRAYGEVWRFPAAGDNVITVVPLGAESYRVFEP